MSVPARRAAGPAARRLAPLRHPTPDFFVCDIFPASPKDDLATMEHPVFSLATRADLRVLHYVRGGVEITVTPSVRGRATLFDKDILIYCISQLVAALNRNQPVARRLTLRAHDLLVATNRETSGDGYRRLVEAFERLAGTRITTNIRTAEIEETRGFGLIEDWRILRATRGGRMISVEVTLSEWLYRAVLAKSVLTLSPAYFRLRKPLERRIYELARKHCGRQPEWRVGLATLQLKAGSASPRRVFRRMIRDLIAADLLPDYRIEELPGDLLRVTPRPADAPGPDPGTAPEAPRDGAADGGDATAPASRMAPRPGPPASGPGLGAMPAPAGQTRPGAAAALLSEATLATARARAPGWDVHALAARWRASLEAAAALPPADPDAAFLAWLTRQG